MNKKQPVLSAISVNNISVEVCGNEKVVGDYFNDSLVNIIARLKHKSFGCDLFKKKFSESRLEMFIIIHRQAFKTVSVMQNKTSCGLNCPRLSEWLLSSGPRLALGGPN